ncbi:MAG: FkbM family methyltransferase [Deltaproteobacteria bacterium]|nr:FkbM family methyltransferase [Deltaproteobacteria bacterium]
MTPKLLHFVVPRALSDTQTTCIERARQLHPHWDIKIWHDDVLIDGARLSRYLDRASSGAQRADLIRLDALLVYGGIYLDSDFRLLRAFDDFTAHYDFFIGTEDGYNLSNGLIGAAPQHPAIAAIVDFLEDNEPNWSAPPNETTGPVLFANVLRWRQDVHILPRETFYPYNWNEPRSAIHRLSYAEHLWAAGWKKNVEKISRQQRVVRSAKLLGKRALRPMLSAGLSGLRRAKRAAEDSSPGFLQMYQPRMYPCSEEIVISTVHGQKIVLDGRDLSVTPDVALRGYHEWPEEAFVRRTLRGGDWFVDIGANCGTFSILAASLCGPLGRVLAFEPNPHIHLLLSKSSIINSYHDRIQIFDFALGDAQETKMLSYYPCRHGDAQIGASEKAGDPISSGNLLSRRKEIDVSIRRLDDLIPINIPIKIMKVDGEGHEPKILDGSMRLLAERAFDFIIIKAEIELAPRNWGNVLRSLRMLIDVGYKPGILDGNGFVVPCASLHEALGRRSGKTLIFTAS